MDNQPRILHVTIDTDTDTGSSGHKPGRSNKQRSPASATNGASQKPNLPIDTLARLLSQRNITLLKMIKTARPESVAELARMSGRPKASLTLTLRRLEQFGIVVFKANGGRKKTPTVACDRLMLEVQIEP